jgi:allophanate hydrolase subunit 1
MTEPVIAPYGDTAWLVEFSESTDRAVVHQLARDLATGSAGAVRGAGDPPRKVRDVTVGDRTLVVRLSAGSAPDGSAEERTWLDKQVHRVQDGLPGAPPSRPATVLPVTFDGEDLDAVAESAGLSTDRVISLLLGAELRVAFVGFAPGFAYLTGLPPPLSGIPRRATPRRSVPAGSVAIAGGFAAVYPAATPGGWHLVGHTPVRMFDPAVAPYALLAAGDRVRFRPEGDADAPESASASAKAPRPRLRSRSTRWVDVVEPGSLTLVQDAGRPGTAGIGVPEAGAADPDSMVLANRLVGNEDGAAVLEIVGRGPVLRFGCPVHLAVVTPGRTGLDLRADGFSLPSDAVVPLQGGQLA